MIIFVALALTVLAFFFVLYPLVRQKTSLSDAGDSEKLQELRSERDTSYSMLKELEFDYQSGILTEEDYKEMEVTYKRKAISILRDLDIADGSVIPADDELDEIDQQVLKLRQDKPKSASGSVVPADDKSDEIEQQVLKLRRNKPKPAGQLSQTAVKKFCTQCGSKVNEANNFCASCGFNLSQGENID